MLNSNEILQKINERLDTISGDRKPETLYEPAASLRR